MGFRVHVLTGIVLSICIAPALAGSNMIGRQSQNEGVLVLPAPGKVVIDGNLDDWDLSGRIWVFADSAVRSRYSVEVAAMWDKDNLYLAAHWKDPTPMYNTVDPTFNPEDGWKSDAWQMRIKTDKNCWITTWYFTPKKMPVMHISDWKNPARDKDGQDITLLAAAEGGTDLGKGVHMAYKADADGKGYVQEIQIPWTLLYKNPPQPQGGQIFRMGMEFLWGDPSGCTWPVHRYADNMQPGTTSREFFWTATNNWGDMKLVDKGNVPVRQYVDEESKLRGSLPIRLTLPAKAARFTVALDDANGNRVRNLGGDLLPEDYAVAGTPASGVAKTVEVAWDGLDDRGRMVSPGQYQVRALSHEGLGAEYVMCYYNPGTPPWGIKDGSGSWGADHFPPKNAAASGDWMILSWTFAEGGSGIIALDANGHKRWGEKRGGGVLAADANSVYAVADSWHTANALCRFDSRTGAYKPFVLDGKARPFDLKLSDIFGGEANTVLVAAMAAGDGKLVLALASGRLAVLDAESAKVLQTIDVPSPTAVGFGASHWYVLSEGKLFALDLTAGKLSAVPTPGLKFAGAVGADLKLSPLPVDLGQHPLQTGGAIAVDPKGNILIVDQSDSQVKAFSSDGRLMYTCGRKGGRPIRGDFDEQTMTHVSSVAADARGNVWTVESWNYPRRVSVWSPSSGAADEGKLVRDYIGNTGYSGVAAYLHETDPMLAYVGPMEFKMDFARHTWKISKILWNPSENPADSEAFGIQTGDNEGSIRFASSVSGKERQYMYAHAPWDGGPGHCVYMERDGKWQPVAAINLAGNISGKINHDGTIAEKPSGELAGLNAYDVVFWNDRNKDGKVQRDECEVLAAKKPSLKGEKGEAAISLRNGWGGRIGKDLVFYMDGIVRVRPTSFTDDGAPIYGKDSIEKLPMDDVGDMVPVVEENRLLCLGSEYHPGYVSLTSYEPNTGRVQWSYPNPYPGVHGSHNATMPKPGLLIGPLKIVGVAQVNDSVGRVFLMRGNLGQDFYMTTDGLYVGAMFQDGRLPGEPLPDKESQLYGMPMENFSGGGEPFNGWFGKQSDGKIRMTNGMPGQAAMVLEIKGLETVQRFAGPAITVDAAAVVKANEDNAVRAAAAGAPKSYSIKRLDKVTVDAKTAKWADIAAMSIQRPLQQSRASAKLAYDDKNLYVLFDVSDPAGWQNEGKDFTRLFKTGAAVDVQLCASPEAAKDAKRTKVGEGDLRVVIASLNGKPAAVLMRAVDPSALADKKVNYASPVGTKTFDRVEVIESANVALSKTANHYVLEAAIPLEALGLKPQAGLTLRGDVGFISADSAGTINTARTYWANSSTNLVNDLPLEAWLTPQAWGELKFE